MGTKGRGSNSHYGRKPGNGSNLLRGFLVMIALGAASFALGFFVLSPLMRTTGTSGSSGGRSSATEAQNQANLAANSPRSTAAPLQNAPPAASSRKPSESASPGPSVEPIEEEVQQPENLDAPNPGTSAETPGRAGETVSPPADNSGDNSPASSTRRRRQREKTEVQIPETLDTPNTAAPPVNRTETGTGQTGGNPGATASSTGAASGLFRVQTGVYSTPVAAEQEVQRLREKGFEGTVLRFEKEGRALYRVQTGIYRERANAEANRKRLTDAGIEATISGS